MAFMNQEQDPLFQTIAALANTRSISGREEAAGTLAASLLRQFVPDASFRDGSVTAHLHAGDGLPTLLLCAHLDQVGFLVTAITPEGFLRIGAVGGIDRRILPGQPVTVLGKKPLFGVISILPPHVLKDGQEVPEENRLCVDLGFSSAEELKGLVQCGDAVSYGTVCMPLQGDAVTGSALDDRCCVAALIRTAELLQGASLPCNVTFVFSGQEERSGRGARLAAFSEKPDSAIAVDVTFGMVQGEDADSCMELGQGPAIGISPVLSPALSERLLETAEMAAIPCQREIMPGGTGTDADSLALAPGGCEAGTVSIPLRYMHTPVEEIRLSDVEQTAQLLAAYAKECGRA